MLVPLRHAGEAPFYIPATDAPARPRRNLKHNDTFAVFDSHGDIGASARRPGRAVRLRHPLSVAPRAADRRAPGRCCCTRPSTTTTSTIYVDLTNPDIYADGRIVLLKDTVHISRTIYLVRRARCASAIGLMNHGAEPVSFTLSLAFASDFADIFEVRGIERKRRGRGSSEVLGPGGVAAFLPGLDGALRQTTLCFEPAPTAAARERRHLQGDARPAGESARSSSRSRVAAACPRSTASFFRGLIGLNARAARPRRGMWRPSRPPTRSSTRSCAGRWPTSTC